MKFYWNTPRKRFWLLLLCCHMFILHIGVAQEQGFKIFLKTPKGMNSAVVHDQSSKTIDMFFVATESARKFWDFDEQNLFIQEKIGQDSFPLEVVFQGIVNDTLLGLEEVYQVKTRSSKDYHQEKRTYIITWKSLPDAKTGLRTTLARATTEEDWNALKAFSLTRERSFWDLGALAAFILLLLLLLFSEVFPIFKIWGFKRRYVFPYSQIQKTGERKLNPITGQPLMPNEMVVRMCDREICAVPYKTWKRRNYQCLHCPENCDGNANIWSREFFTQKGGARRYNWIWFGATGGALAGLLFLVGKIGLAEYLTEELENILLGFSMGFGLLLMLSWVEEIGQGRGVSIGRIALRTLMGATIGSLLFFGLSRLGDSNLLGAVTWVLFCLLAGLILSFHSSISWQRGLLSGAIAGLVSGLIYYIIPILFPNPEASLVKVITLLFAGGILGQGLLQVVRQLDKIELQVISPAYRNGVVFALDNFLKAGKNILIGTDMKAATVRVKWEDDHVLARHAEMKMSNNKVFIRPLGEAEIWIDDTQLQNGKSLQINGGEMIRLGRQGKTVFKYLQKS